MTFHEYLLKLTDIRIKIEKLQNELILLQDSNYFEDVFINDTEDIEREVKNQLAELYKKEYEIEKIIKELM